MQDPQSLHKYAYVHGNPVSRIDPTGMFSLGGMAVAMGVGHSLGGGLATAAALHTSQKAVTFNAAGVNSWTTNTSNAARLITNYRVKGEILSTLLDLPAISTFMPHSSAGDTFWLKGRSSNPIDRHTKDILEGMRDFF